MRESDQRTDSAVNCLKRSTKVIEKSNRIIGQLDLAIEKPSRHIAAGKEFQRLQDHPSPVLVLKLARKAIGGGLR